MRVLKHRAAHNHLSTRTLPSAPAAAAHSPPGAALVDRDFRFAIVLSSFACAHSSIYHQNGRPCPLSEVRFYYDVVCPYAYMAATRVQALSAERGVAVRWVPVLLGGLFRHQVPSQASGQARLARSHLLSGAVLG